MRLFVAVDLPDVVRRSAAEAGERLRDRLSRARARSRITWVAPGVLHLTLVFLGEVDEETGRTAVERMRPPLPVQPFRLGLGGAGTFPAAGRPRVLWLAVREGAEGIAAARAAVGARLEGLPYRRDDRPFAPHLTLGRFRDGGTTDERRTVAESGIAPSTAGLVDHVTLYQSRLSPRGPEHTALVASPLAPEEGA